MTGYEAYKILKKPSRIPKKETFKAGKILLNAVDAVRTEDRETRELVRDLLGTSSIAYFPQDRGKMIYTKSRETPINAKELPYFVWVKVSKSVSIGFRRSRAIDSQKRKFNEYLRRKTGIAVISQRRG